MSADFTRLRTRLTISVSDERGVALPMVLMVFLVGVALIAAFLVAIVGSSNVTVANKNIVQAEAAAQAGLAEGEAFLRLVQTADPCTVPFDGPRVPEDEDDEGGWAYSVTRECSGPAGDRTLVLTSVGTDGGATRAVQAVFNVNGGETPGPVTPVASGNHFVYSGGQLSSDFDSEFVMSVAAGHQTNIAVRHSDLSCVGAVMPVDVYASKNAVLNGCTFRGDFFLGGNMNPTGIGGFNQFDGDVYLAGSGPHTIYGEVKGDVYANGDVTVHWDSRLLGGLHVSGAGTATVQGKVAGSVFVGGSASVPGKIGEDLHVTGTGTTLIAGTVTRNVYVGGSVKMDWGSSVGGSISASGPGQTSEFFVAPTGDILTAGNVDVKAWNIVFPGTITAAGTVNLIGGNRVGPDSSSCTVKVSGPLPQSVSWNQPPWGYDTVSKICPTSTVALDASQLDAPEAVIPPEIHDWTAYSYTSAGWPGWTIDTVKSNQCKQWFGDGASNKFKNLDTYVKNTIIDFRECKDLSSSGMKDAFTQLKLKANLVFLLPENVNLTLEKLAISSSATGVERELYIVQPAKALASGVPECKGSTGDTVPRSIYFNETNISSDVKTMIYTPCKVDFNNSSLTGNLFAGQFVTGGTTSFAFAPISLPGWSTGGGNGNGNGGGQASGDASLGELISIRNISTPTS